MVTISPGQQHETQQAIPLVDKLPVLSATPQRPKKLVGDKGYSAGWLRQWLRERQVEPVIAHQKKEAGAQEPFDRESYRQRHWIEQCVGWLKEKRRLATRYEKLAIHYLGMLTIGMILQYLKP